MHRVCVVVCCSVLQSVAVSCTVLQCVAVCCSVPPLPPFYGRQNVFQKACFIFKSAVRDSHELQYESVLYVTLE